jgi:hypothetical protein
LNTQDNISRVNAPRAGQLAFAAQHAFPCFSFHFAYFTPFDISYHFSQAEIGEQAGAAGGRTGPAGHADLKRWLILRQVPGKTEIVPIIVDLPVRGYGVAEVSHFQSLVFGLWSLVLTKD